jgi:hypothetical protein
MTAPGNTTDPVAFFQEMIQELSASGSTPLTAKTDTVPAPNLTLRGAIGAILWITNAGVDMKGTAGPSERPFPPGTPDTILGHILSLRAEQLQTQSLVSALITALVQAKIIAPVDQVGILNAVRTQF